MPDYIVIREVWGKAGAKTTVCEIDYSVANGRLTWVSVQLAAPMDSIHSQTLSLSAASTLARPWVKHLHVS